MFKKNLPEGSVEKLLDYLEARLAAQSFVEGDEFSVADVAVTSYLMFFKVFLPQVGPRSPSEQCFCQPVPWCLSGLLLFCHSWRPCIRDEAHANASLHLVQRSHCQIIPSLHSDLVVVPFNGNMIWLISGASYSICILPSEVESHPIRS